MTTGLSELASVPPLHAAAVVVAALAATLLVRFAVGFFRFLRRENVLASVPQASGGNFFLGHVIPLLQQPKRMKGAWDLMEDWVKAQGPIVRFRILGTHGVVVADPLGLKRIFQVRQKSYEKDLKLSYHPFLPILGTGLVTADGELWQKQRLLMGPTLRVEVLDDIVSIAYTAVNRLCAKFETVRGTGKVVDMEEEFRLLTLQVIGEAVLSLSPEECDRVFPTLYLPVMTEGNKRVLRPYRKYVPIPAWWKFKSNMKALNSYLIGLIRGRWQARKAGNAPKKGDILDRILAAVDADGTPWSESIEVQLCYEIKTFLLAGHETSAAMLSWSMLELAKSEACRAKVLAEAEEAFGPKNAEPSRPVVDGMIYTLSVLKEALRKYSVVPVVTRNLVEDDELMGHKVPAGTMIVCNLQGTHNLYKQPEAFRPERFMPNGEYDQFDEAIRPYMFVPFIQGPRNCLGQHLALLEARVILAMLTKRFKFSLVDPNCGVRHPTIIPVAAVDGMKMTIS